MPSGKDSAQDGVDRIMKSFALVTLPWLAFQQEMLGIMKKSVENATLVRPLENLASRELQALMMIFDRSGKLRNLLDHDLEKKIGDAYTSTFPKMVSGSIQFIEAQEALLATVSNLLDTLRKNSNSSGSESGNAVAKSE
jgi:hypothetical protein